MSKLTHWLVKEIPSIETAMESLEIWNTYFPESSTPKRGDILFFLSESEEKYSSFDWKVSGAFSIKEVSPVDSRSSNRFQIELSRYSFEFEMPNEKTLDCYKMSFSNSEANRIKEWLYSAEKLALNLTPRAGNVIVQGIEFPIGSTMRLLLNHFGQFIQNDLKSISIPNNITGLAKWEFAFNYLIQSLQENIMRSAFYASQAKESWGSLIEYIDIKIPLDQHIFFAPRTETNAGPPEISCTIPFDLATEIVNQWQVTEERQRGPESVVLNQVLNSSLSDQRNWEGYKFPAFPGGLFHEF